jgi:hypothetical protein
MEIITQDFFALLLLTTLGALVASMAFALIFILEEFVRKLRDKR